MSTVRGEFVERSAEPRIRRVGLAHVSVELGHLYMEDLVAGPKRIREVLAEARPWAETAVRAAGSAKPRVSTCFLIDDYFSQVLSPAVVVPQVMEAAAATGTVIDYLARESACAWLPDPSAPPPGGTDPARMLVDRIVREPVEGANGSRPAAADAGWLANGTRSPSDRLGDAMNAPGEWESPRQAAARNHSIFVDVELWKDRKGERKYSCALLAAVWQAFRLGLLRDREGHPLAEPADPPAAWPERWADLPPVVRLSATKTPFCAYTTFSFLSPRFLPVEIAVRTILSQVLPEPEVTEQIAGRAAGEGFALPPEAVDRIRYAFGGSGSTDPA